MSDKGFTLVELIVIIAIAGILAAVGVMSFSGMIAGYRFKGAARDIYSDLQMTRLGAIKDGTEWAMCFSDDGTFSSYSIRSSPGADRILCTTDDPTPYRKSVASSDLYPGATYVESFSGAKVSFTSRGTSENGNVTITSAPRSRKVVVNGMSGNIRIE